MVGWDVKSRLASSKALRVSGFGPFPLSAAIAAFLTRAESMARAVEGGKTYITQALERGVC